MVYPSAPPTQRARARKDLILRLKQNTIHPETKLPASRGFARSLAKVAPATWLAECFTDRSILVPVPRSTPVAEGSLWPALEIATALVEVGLGAKSIPLLVRRTAVAKSAVAAIGARPTPREHYESMVVKGGITPPERLLVVDDVVSGGNTVLAAASRLAEAFPNTEIVAFAAARTVRGADPEQLIEPCRGLIVGDESGARRVDDA